MDIKTLLFKLNQIDCVIATCKDSFLTIRMLKFKPLFVNLASDTYNANYLPPLPPVEWMQLAGRRDHDRWHEVFNVLRKYYESA